MTRADVWGCLRGVAGFAPLLLAPGYCAGLATNAFGFRARSMRERLAWGVALSFAVVPVAAVLLGRVVSGLDAVCWLAVLCGMGMLGLIGWEIVARRARMRESDWWLAAASACWSLFVVLELVDVVTTRGMWMSVTVFDHGLRTAFVDAVMRTGVPPSNPLFWPGHAVAMRYYYFWYVVVAAAAKLAGISARQAMIASVVWAGFGLFAIACLYCRHFLPQAATKQSQWSRSAVVAALLGVTGLDLLPAIAKAVMRLPTDADSDWWAPDQVGSWMDSLLWVPHHVVGLVCCLTGFLLVWMSKDCSGWRRWGCGVVAGVAFASAFGLSTWVALAFAMVMAGWSVWVLCFEQQSRRRIGVLLLAAGVTVAALTPYLAELSRGAASGAVGVLLLRFGVRHMIDPEGLLGVPGLAHLKVVHPQLEDAVAGLLLLAPGYALELGLYGLVLIAAWRRRRTLPEAERTALALACLGLAVASFLRSTVITNNDFGYRSMLVPQFFLLLLGLVWWQGRLGEGRAMRRAMTALLWVGLAGTAYQVGLLRIYMPVEESLGRPGFNNLAQQALQVRQALEAMQQSTPPDAIVQFAPGATSYLLDTEVMEAGRQMAAGLPGCGSVFGGNARDCVPIENGVGRIFAVGTTPDTVQRECGRLGITELAVGQWDAVWGERGGWVWTLPAVADSGGVRVVRCGSASR